MLAKWHEIAFYRKVLKKETKQTFQLIRCNGSYNKNSLHLLYIEMSELIILSIASLLLEQFLKEKGGIEKKKKWANKAII